MPKRTYELDPRVIQWIDKMSDKHGRDKSEIVNRALKVYAAKTSKGDWKDPKFNDPIDRMFTEER